MTLMAIIALVLALATCEAKPAPSIQPSDTCTVTAQIGCFSDKGEHASPSERTLKTQVEDAKSLEECAAHCDAHGFTDNDLKGMEYGRQCYCGHSLQNQPTKEPDSDCSMPCESTNATCGGKYLIQVFNATCSASPTPPPTPALPTPPPTPAPPTPPPPPTPKGSGRPCDILAAAGNPCVAAHSTTRALYAAYSGPLYNVTRDDGKSANIGVLIAGGFANASAQDQFCAGADCVISNIFDQSPMGNHLGPRHKLVNASRHKITVGNNVQVYGMWFDPGVSAVCVFVRMHWHHLKLVSATLSLSSCPSPPPFLSTGTMWTRPLVSPRVTTQNPSMRS
jgi:hypothetical protein